MSSLIWDAYSPQMKDRIQNMLFAKHFTKELAEAKELFLSQSKSSDDCMRLYVLVDKQDGVICDAAYQVLGSSMLIALLETLCALLIRKNHMQAQRISKELIAKELGIGKDFFVAIEPYIERILKLMDLVLQPLAHISVKDVPDTPIPEIMEKGDYIKQFFTMPLKEKIQYIEHVIEEDIRPYIELDSGGVEVMDLKGNIVKIQYSGNCLSCPSAIGGTLSYIQETLQSKIHPDLIVEPDLSHEIIN
ncbi:MAG: hypothetical protein K940chlam8_00785 [Chlamydiae bacterium]|nr:hypothetical protein [Chlamydiota bacterium]